jgi:hypothetical protein
VLAARGDTAAARWTIDDALRENPGPPSDIAVRTTRYRGDLEKLRAEIGPR